MEFNFNNSIKTCVVCCKIGIIICENCRKVSYCSKLHQVKHKKRHKEDCFPAYVQRDNIKGRYVVATRRIEQGEMIIEESPLVTGPNYNSDSNQIMPLCLSCYKQVFSKYKCSKCSWPMCDSECEKAPHHAGFECPILKEKNIPPAEKAFAYLFVIILRCVLLRDSDPVKWKILMELEHHNQYRLTDTYANKLRVQHDAFVRHEFKKHFGASFCPGDTLSQIIGAIEVNCHGISNQIEYSGFCREGWLLMNFFSLVSHDCVPNAFRFRIDHPTPCPSGTFSLRLVAAVPIEKGEIISICYSYDTADTFLRQMHLVNHYFFECNCKRCIDPTEIGTYYSAYKCPKQTCVDGYILPVVSENNSWKCDKCENVNDMDYLQNAENICYDAYEMLDLNPTEENLQKCEKFFEIYEGKMLHTNNHLLFELRERMVQMMQKLPNPSVQFLEKQVSLCQSVIFVMDRIFPGLGCRRGDILYRLYKAKFRLLEYKLLEKTPCPPDCLSSASEPTLIMSPRKWCEEEKTLFHELLQIGDNSMKILLLTSEGSVWRFTGAKFQIRLKQFVQTHSSIISELGINLRVHYPNIFFVINVNSINESSYVYSSKLNENDE